jgi:hypothetical protein
MSPMAPLTDRRIPYVLLWIAAAVCFGFAVTETPVFGFEQSQLLLLATVFAAVTSEYTRRSRSCGTDQES